jgi:DNA-binding GntR family transcriptional regulator
MTDERATRTGAVYVQVREAIFDGTLEPGRRLRLVEMATRFSVSQSVIREALTRLAGQGLVVAAPQQGFRVVTLSLTDLEELTEARIEIECAALRLSIQRGDLAWEAGAVAAHHHLAATRPLPEGGSKADAAWFGIHERFHQSLLQGCANTRLLGVALSLRDAATIYRRWSVPIGHDYDRDVASEHQALLNAAVSRDADLASDLLAQHIDRTSQALRASAEHGATQ